MRLIPAAPRERAPGARSRSVLDMVGGVEMTAVASIQPSELHRRYMSDRSRPGCAHRGWRPLQATESSQHPATASKDPGETARKTTQPPIGTVVP